MVRSSGHLSPGVLTVTLLEGLGLRTWQNEACSESVDFTDSNVSKLWLPCAVLEYNVYRLTAEAFSWGQQPNIVWEAGNTPWRFDVSIATELLIHLFVRSTIPCHKARNICLGLVRLNPFQLSKQPDMQWLDVQDGPGRLNVGVSFTEKEMTRLTSTIKWATSRNSDSDSLFHVEPTDSGRIYGLVNTAVDAIIPGSEITPLAHPSHPFIAPISFSFRSKALLQLLSPLASNGALVGELQMARRFTLDTARFYTSELTIVLEYLHRQDIVASLMPENIIIEAFGHLNLCIPAIFSPALRDGHGQRQLTRGYPAPELLTGCTTSQATDWWILGVFRHEMLARLPPFYHKDILERRDRIASEEIQLPEEAGASTKDILR